MAILIGCTGAPATRTNVPAITDGATRPIDAAAPIDAAKIDAAKINAPRGAACASDAACATGLACLGLPGGYCTSPCTAPCDGVCVETVRDGAQCLASCTADAACRIAEGYVCDPVWRACVIPHLAALVPPACPEPTGLGRDPAFAPSVALGPPGAAQPSAVILEDGALVALFTVGERLGLARVDPAAPGGAIISAAPPWAASSAGASLPPIALTAPRSARARDAEPWLVRDARGTLYAVWLAADADRAEIVLARSRDRGATWSAPVAVHEPGDCAAVDCVARPMLAIGPDPARRGSQVLYLLYASHGLRVRASRDGGATFGAARTALAGSYGSAAVGFDGRLHAIAISGGAHGGYGSADQRIDYTVSRDGGATFAPPVSIAIRDERLPYYFANPSVALDGRRGWQYLAYARGGRDGRWDLVVVASRDRGKTWARTRIGDDPPCAIHLVPNLAVDPTTGRLHAAWYDSRGRRYAHAACPPGAATCTQRGRIDDAPFAALSTARAGPAWLGDHQALVVDDRRRALHAVWTQPVAEGDQIRTRVFHAAAKLTAR